LEDSPENVIHEADEDNDSNNSPKVQEDKAKTKTGEGSLEVINPVKVEPQAVEEKLSSKAKHSHK